MATVSADVEIKAVHAQTIGQEADAAMSETESEDHLQFVDANRRNQGRCSWLPAAVSNFTIAFNFASASMASLVMKSHNDEINGVNKENYDFPEPQWVHTTMKSAVFIGSIAGMLFMGYLGDAIGIRKALIATNSLVVFGAAASALLTWGDPDILYAFLVLWRFVLGIGVGGNYPLSAAKASSTGTVEEAVSKAGQAFFWQGPGALAPYFIGWLLLHQDASEGITSFQFRFILGLGAIPACAIVYFMYQEKEPPKTVPKKRTKLDKTLQRHEKTHYRKTLIGTGGTWLMFDIAFYGTAIFAPSIMKSIFPHDASLKTIALRSAILPACGILGTIVGMPLLRLVGPQILNAVGLVVAALLYVAFIFIKTYASPNSNILFSILCAIFFVLMGGPSIATYVLPVMSFPRSVRATYHGRSGSWGKVGAMLGTFIFPIIMDFYGISGVFFVQAIACLFSAVFGLFLIKPLEVLPLEDPKSGRDRKLADMDQDEISEAGLEHSVYYRDERIAEANIVAIQKMQSELSDVHCKIDAIMLHLRIPQSPAPSPQE